MKIVDANYILRYLLGDIKEQFEIAATTIEKNNIFIPGEIIAEVVYVLQKVYSVPAKTIQTALCNLLNYPTISINEKKVTINALAIFSKKNVDYADALLIAFATTKNATVYTFDKKVNKIIEKSK
jgi:predicted nucleic-acid-binding protein